MALPLWGVTLNCDYQSAVEVASATTTVSVVEFTATADLLPDTLPSRIEGRAALTPARDARDLSLFYVWGDGHWNPIAPATDAERPAPGTSFTARIETKTLGNFEIVSYLVKFANQTTFTRLQTTTGRTWFRAGTDPQTTGTDPMNQASQMGTDPTNRASVLGTDPTNQVSVTGSVPTNLLVAAGAGEVGNVTWQTGTDPGGMGTVPGGVGTDPTTYYWIGKEGSAWEDGANWSLAEGGEPVGTVPAKTNEIAKIVGETTISYGGKKITVRDLLVAFTTNGAQIVGGEVVAEAVSLKTNRPILGKTIGPDIGSIFGDSPRLDCAWYRADWTKTYTTTPISVASSYTLSEDDREHWLLFVAHDDSGVRCRKEFYFSELPVAYLTTMDGDSPSAQKEEHAASLFIQGNADWKHQYDGMTSIKVRGNSTANYAKKPYKLKLDQKTNLFGMGKNKHWVLLANWNDPSMLRNKLAGDFANDIGFLGMDSTWVQCILNGAFIGTYQLSEHVRPDSKRVPVFDWEDAVEDATNLSAIDSTTQDITGGYLFEFTEEYDELTKFTTTAGKLQMRTSVARPEYLYTNPSMLAFCQNFLGNYWQACTAWNGYSPEGRHWSEYCEISSMIDFFLVNELFSNTDACKHSRFAYLNPGGKLTWGPVWDFDCSSGYMNAGTTTPTVWATAGNLRGDLSVKYAMQKEWASDPWFCHRLRARYWEIRPTWINLFHDGGLIDQYAAKLAVPCAANDARWPRPQTFTEDTATLKTFLAQRLDWLDAQFADTDTLIKSLNIDIATHPYVKDSTKLPLAFVGTDPGKATSETGTDPDNSVGTGPGNSVGTDPGKVASETGTDPGNSVGTDPGKVASGTGTGPLGRQVGGLPLRISFAVGDATITSVEIFVNGLRVGCVDVVGGRVEADIPRTALTASPQIRDLVSLVAYNTSGTVVARTYAFAYHDDDGFKIIIR